jgi:RNA recognition motif-containing protein
MAAADEAQKAITALNGTEFGGRSLVVNEACPQENRAFGGDGGGGRSGGGDQRGRW